MKWSALPPDKELLVLKILKSIELSIVTLHSWSNLAKSSAVPEP